MTETATPDGSAPETGAPAFPPGRYGRRREPRSRRPAVVAVLTAAVVAAGLVAAWRLGGLYSGDGYSPRLLAYDDSVPGQVTVTFEVYKPAGEGAVCTVRSRNLDGVEIGADEVLIPADERTRVETSYTLEVTGEPNTGEVPRCRKAD